MSAKLTVQVIKVISLMVGGRGGGQEWFPPLAATSCHQCGLGLLQRKIKN
jgi:hypothetical protein